MSLRSTRSPGRRRSGGFSLIEVIVALAILGIAIVSLVQLFSASLRSTKRSAEYTVALIHARSLMEEAYAATEVDDINGSFDFDDGYGARREAEEIPPAEGEEKAPYKLYEITVTVTWPPRGVTVLKGRRVVYEAP